MEEDTAAADPLLADALKTTAEVLPEHSTQATNSSSTSRPCTVRDVFRSDRVHPITPRQRAWDDKNALLPVASSPVKSAKRCTWFPRRNVEYDFMRSDTQPMRGLQDWALQTWTEHLRGHPKDSKKLLAALLDIDLDVEDLSPLYYKTLAEQVKQKMNCAMVQHKWQSILEFQNNVSNISSDDSEVRLRRPYLHAQLRSGFIFDREFPLGVENGVLMPESSYKFALRHSGLSSVHHEEKVFCSRFVYGLLISVATGIITLIILYAQDDVWDLAATTIDHTQQNWAVAVSKRTKHRAFVATMMSTLSFALSVNTSMAKIGKVDPSTSTVFIGTVLGNTWAFVLDNMLGTDEGFREYLWSCMGGMKYGIGSLGTERYARYVITTLFDTFFTVILFKRLYSFLVRLAGFTKGREWIACGLVSALISYLIFEVYASLTRLEWAYPTGAEEEVSEWISGSTMIIAVVSMNMVFLISETRCKIGERGINDPPFKLLYTLFTFVVITGLHWNHVTEPRHLYQNITEVERAAFSNPHLRLKGVCETNDRFQRGLLLLFLIIFCCYGFVIFVTSKQSVEGLAHFFSLPQRS